MQLTAYTPCESSGDHRGARPDCIWIHANGAIQRPTDGLVETQTRAVEQDLPVSASNTVF